MVKQNEMAIERRKQRLGLLLFSVGLLLGMSVALLIIWGDLEASLFDVTFQPEQRLTTLRCPPIITADEETAVQATFHNERESEENIIARARISSGFVTLIREEETRLTLPPGGSQTLEWPISAADAAWGRVVLVRVGAVQRVPYPQLVGAACGVLLLPIQGISGTQFVLAVLMVTFVSLIGGGWLWGIGRRPLNSDEKKMRRTLLVYAGLMLLALLCGFLSRWLLGLFLVIAIVVYASSTIEKFAFAWRR